MVSSPRPYGILRIRLSLAVTQIDLCAGPAYGSRYNSQTARAF